MDEYHEDNEESHFQDFDTIDSNNATDDDQYAKSRNEYQYFRQRSDVLFTHDAMNDESQNQRNQNNFHNRHGHGKERNFNPLASQSPDDEGHHDGCQQSRTGRNGYGQRYIGFRQEAHDVGCCTARTGPQQNHADSHFRWHLKSQYQSIGQERHNRVVSRAADEDFFWPLQDESEVFGMQRHPHTKHDDPQKQYRMRYGP